MTAGRPTASDDFAYEGERAQTTTRHSHFRCRCGALVACDLVISVDANEDPEVARSATELGVERGLHRVSCDACGSNSIAPVPFTYHDGEQQVFALVLPESYRSRELEERAALLLSLAQEADPIPDYVVEPVVVYGPDGLSEFLVGLMSARDEQRRDARRLRDVEKRLEEAARREERIRKRETELEALTEDLDSRSTQLTAKELGLRDRKGALDRRTQELERMTVAIAEAKEQLRAESQGELPEALRDDATDVLDVDDVEHVLTSAPNPSSDSAVSQVMSASGTSASNAPVSAPEDPLGLDDDDDPILLTSETRIAPKPGSESGSVRAPSDIETGEQLEITMIPDAPATTEPSLSPPTEAQLAQATAQPLVPRPEIGDQDVTIPTASGQEVEAWRTSGDESLKVLHTHEVALIVSLRPSGLEELLASDIRALLQLHRMPTYPLISLTLARATTLAGQPGKPYSFHFDIGSAEDREVLERLSEDFRFRLEIHDTDHRPVRQRRLAAPLASNVHYVMALASDARKDLPPERRDYQQAVKAFNNVRYDRLGRGHRLARGFKDSLLDRIGTPAALQAAIAQCGRFSAPPGEEYLIAIRSYPFERWHKRRLEVIKQALAYGLWMGPDLARVAVSEELVRSRKELVTKCQANFKAHLQGPDPGLSESSIQANWAALDAESSGLGLSAGKKRRAPSPMEIGQEEQRLLNDLEDPTTRLQAIVALCEMKSLSGMDPVFRALAELDAREAAEAFGAITRLGNQAAESLLVLQTCPAAHLRHGAALALCELGNEEGIDATCESLMTSEGTIWREYAVALGRVGSSAVMPLVARIASSGQRGQARAVWALGYMALGGASKPVETLAGGRDQAVSQVASAALELRERLRTDTVKVERNPAEKDFTDAFIAAVGGENPGYASADLSGPAMLLDEADLMEAT